MKHLYRFIILSFICFLFLVTGKAQSISNSYAYSYTYTNVYTAVSTHTDFTYTGAAQTYTATPGTYTLEVWGAQGGNSNWDDGRMGSYGGYSK